ncbi:hypothetical protein ACFWXA_12825 [Streptomyces atroolivaceus]
MSQLWERLRTVIQKEPALGGKDIGVAKTLVSMNNVITGIA